MIIYDKKHSCANDKCAKIREKLIKSDEYVKSVEKASEIFSLLGEPARIKIVLALMEGELCVYHICDITGGKQSATSQHLRKLKDGNIVKAKKVGNQVLYSIADEHVKTIINTAILQHDCD
jgi:DNA-binding transcriptional ArsR family regulator